MSVLCIGHTLLRHYGSIFKKDRAVPSSGREVVNECAVWDATRSVPWCGLHGNVHVALSQVRRKLGVDLEQSELSLIITCQM